MIAASTIARIAGQQRTAMPSILMMDDNPGDAELMRIAVEMSALEVELIWVADGHAGLRELARRIAERCPPALILLDLNMPRMDGAEVLARLQADVITARIPVVVLSISGRPAERTRLLRAGASAFLRKPDCIGDLVALVGGLRTFPGIPAAGTGSCGAGWSGPRPGAGG